MPTNLLKKYPSLLELIHLNEVQKMKSLRGVVNRDFEDNQNLTFNRKMVRPIKGEEPAMQLLFKHLTTHEETVEDENGNPFKRRVFELERSQRLHWVRFHVDQKKTDDMEVFSVEERSSGKKVIRTYILDKEQRYVVILEPYRIPTDYYLITAYKLEARNFKKMKNKMKRKLNEIA